VAEHLRFHSLENLRAHTLSRAREDSNCWPSGSPSMGPKF